MLRSLHSISLRIASRTRAPTALQSSRVTSYLSVMPPKRKRSSVAATTPTANDASPKDRTKMRRTDVPLPPNVSNPPPRRQSTRGGKAVKTDPNLNPDILDGATALRASPDGHDDAGTASIVKPPISNGIASEVSAAPDASTEDKALPPPAPNGDAVSSNAPVANSAASAATAPKNKRKKAGATHVKVEKEDTSTGAVNGVAKAATSAAANAGVAGDPEDADGLEAEFEDEAEVKEALSRPPPVNSAYLPLPWKGRLGYVGVPQVLFNLC
jgi:UV DNA damage endonuclease